MKAKAEQEILRFEVKVRGILNDLVTRRTHVEDIERVLVDACERLDKSGQKLTSDE